MYDQNEKNRDEKGMLYPTIDELTDGKFNRYQLAIGAARGARMLTNEYVKQRVIAEKTQSIQKEAGSKDGEKPISAMVEPEYRDIKAVKLSIIRINDGEFKIVEKEDGEVADIDEEFEKELSAELAKLQKQRESLRLEKEEGLGNDDENAEVIDDGESDSIEDEDVVEEDAEEAEKAEDTNAEEANSDEE